MATDGKNQWLFDYVFEMLHSPAWEYPIASFMDENCLVFDAEEENKLVYTELHNEFKDLVEGVLNQQLAEVGVCEEDFYNACEAVFQRGQSDDQDEYARDVVEQIMACADFLTFKKLMFRRNKELELEALSCYMNHNEEDFEDDGQDIVIEGKMALSDEDDYDETGREIDLSNYDPDEALAHAIRESTIAAGGDLEQQQRLAQLDLEAAELETAIALSLVMEEERQMQHVAESKSSSEDNANVGAKGTANSSTPIDDELLQWRAESKTMDGGAANATRGDKITGAVLSPLPARSVPGSTRSLMARQGSIMDQRKAVEAMLAPGELSRSGTNSSGNSQDRVRQMEQLRSNGVDEVDIARRTKHLKAQRERILQRKKEEREQKLREYSSAKKQTGTSTSGKTSEISRNARGGGSSSISNGQQLTYALARKMKHDLVSGDLGVSISTQLI